MDIKNVALIGLGRFGINHWRNLLKLQVEGLCKIVAIADVYKPQAEFGDVPYYKDYKDIFRNGVKVDCVDIVTPASTHFSIAREILSRQAADLFIEKPLAMKVADCDTLLMMAGNRGSKISVGHIFRYDKAVGQIARMVRTKAFGDIHILRMEFEGAAEARSDVGAILDYLHTVDVFDFLMDGEEPKSAKLVTFKKSVYEDYALILLKYKYAIARAEMSWLFPIKKRHISISGSEGSLDADIASFPEPSVLSLYEKKNSNPSEVRKIYPSEEPLYLELKDFLLLRHATDGEIGRRIVQVCESAVNIEN